MGILQRKDKHQFRQVGSMWQEKREAEPEGSFTEV